MSTSRHDILSAIRRHRLDESPLPGLDGPWITYADPVRQFADTLSAVGGRCAVVSETPHVNRELELLPAYREATRICSLVPGVGRSNVDLASIHDPHDLKDVDFAILPGAFGVAENAAVWVSDFGVKHRVLYFIVQHLALVVPADPIVHNMHAAYDRLAFTRPEFGVFISGPSKTADIEQSLVIGAHGPRSLTVFLVGPPVAERLNL